MTSGNKVFNSIISICPPGSVCDNMLEFVGFFGHNLNNDLIVHTVYATFCTYWEISNIV